MKVLTSSVIKIKPITYASIRLCVRLAQFYLRGKTEGVGSIEEADPKGHGQKFLLKTTKPN